MRLEKSCKTETRAHVHAQTTFFLCLLRQTSLRACHHIGRRVCFVLRQLVSIASVRFLQRLDPNVHLPFPHSRGASRNRIGFVDQSSPEIWLALDVLYLGNSLGCPRVHRRGGQRHTGLARGDAQTAWNIRQRHKYEWRAIEQADRETCETKCTQPAYSHMITQNAHTTVTLAMYKFRNTLFVLLSICRSAIVFWHTGACGANSSLASWTCDLLGLRLRGAPDPGSDLTTT